MYTKSNAFVSATCITVKVIDGWPCISESLQWADECPLYLMGQYTALQVGQHSQLKKQKNKILTSLLPQNPLNLNCHHTDRSSCG